MFHNHKYDLTEFNLYVSLKVDFFFTYPIIVGLCTTQVNRYCHIPS